MTNVALKHFLILPGHNTSGLILPNYSSSGLKLPVPETPAFLNYSPLLESREREREKYRERERDSRVK